MFEARLYDVLFRSEEPAELDDWLADLSTDSKEVLVKAYANPALAKATVGSRCAYRQRMNKCCIWVAVPPFIFTSMNHILCVISFFKWVFYCFWMVQLVLLPSGAMFDRAHRAQVSAGALGLLLHGPGLNC